MSIKRTKVKNFASESLSKTTKTKDGKCSTIRMERDIFGRLLGISLRKKIDMEICLAYPLSPCPPALTYPTGEMFKTDKSALAKKLISGLETSVPHFIDVDIIDGFHLLHNLGPSVPQTFGKTAEFILQKICNTTASEIHLIFDRYLHPSIKDCERSSRKEDETAFSITGELQNRPTNFNKSLSNPKFKTALVNFLYEHWINNSCNQILKNKKVFLTVENKCFIYTNDNHNIVRVQNEEYTCDHEEADTRIFFHLNKCSQNSKILIKSVDNDVLIICLGNMEKFEGHEIWMTRRHNNELGYINCTDLAQKLGLSVCQALPGFHAFTGSDYTAAFVRKGKIKPYNLLVSSEKYQDVFKHLTSPQDIFYEKKTSIIQQFTSDLYNVQESDVNKTRFELFLKFFASSSDEDDFYKGAINFNSSNIPPCWKTLTQKILRTIFVNSMWQNVTETKCTLYDPLDCGWQENDGKFEPLWFNGRMAPSKVDEIITNNDSNSEESDDDILNHNSVDFDDE